MIVYQKTKAEFINDVIDDSLTDKVFEAVKAKLGSMYGVSQQILTYAIVLQALRVPLEEYFRIFLPAG